MDRFPDATENSSRERPRSVLLLSLGRRELGRSLALGSLDFFAVTTSPQVDFFTLQRLHEALGLGVRVASTAHTDEEAVRL